MNEISFGLKHNKSLTSMNYAIPVCIRRVEFNEFMNFVDSDRLKLRCFGKKLISFNLVIFATFHSNVYPEIYSFLLNSYYQRCIFPLFKTFFVHFSCVKASYWYIMNSIQSSIYSSSSSSSITFSKQCCVVWCCISCKIESHMYSFQWHSFRCWLLFVSTMSC